jgi:hypothetical protein
MDHDRTTKITFGTRPEGKRRIGRPKLRCRDRVDWDIRLLGDMNWRRLTLNKEERKRLLKTAWAHTRLWSQ